MSIDWIKKNVKVFSKDLTLPLAQKISGLRAVFGEVYPEPVRVVSLEYDVDEIAKDVENPKWRSTSIEFCGGTHVARTGDIKDFVITEESGIAKGIRRIVAVTGHEAQDVTRVADTFEARIKQVELLKGKAKDTALKTLMVELGQADISLLRKSGMRDRLTTLRKAFDKEVKEKETAANKAVCDTVHLPVSY
jgi:alanyl-tRNA synthetase